MMHVSNLSGQELQTATARLPYITVHAFCETAEARDEFVRASQDRRMSRVQTLVRTGGVTAAIAFYDEPPTPNLLILETGAVGAELLEQLDALAAVCDDHTKVMVVGYSNDIGLYRALLQKGISDYLVGPIDAISLIGRIADLYTESSTAKLGRSIAFVGAKGGVGSSTIAQNVASAIARVSASNVVLADLDLAFGNTSLNLDIENRQGIAEAIENASRLDEVLLDRLMTSYEANLNVLTAPASLERTYDLDGGTFDRLLDVAHATVPYAVLDVPHLWSSWTRSVLVTADEVVITAVPDLPNLQNAKHLVDLLKQARPHDGPPRLLLNQVGMPKRKEIKPSEFADALGIEATGYISFEPSVFSAAAVNGKMIADVSAKSSAAKVFRELAQSLTGHLNRSIRRRSLSDLLRRKPKIQR